MGTTTEIIVPVNGHTETEMKGTMMKSFVSWNRILPDIKHLITSKGNEEIIGLEVDETGVTVLIDYKNEK